MLQTALTLYSLSAPAKSNYTMFAKSVHAIVLKVLGETRTAIDVAKDVIRDTGRHRFCSFVQKFTFARACVQRERNTGCWFFFSDCGGIHLTWVKNTYDLLIELLESDNNSDEAELYKNKVRTVAHDSLSTFVFSPSLKQRVCFVAEQMSEWLVKHPLETPPITWEQLNDKPDSFESFMKQHDVWHGKSHLIKKGIQQILASKE